MITSAILSLALSWFCCIMLISEGSFLPFASLDQRPSVGSLLEADPWSEAFSDPFSILEQLPLALEKDESVALSPATVDWKETPKGHLIMVDVPGLEKDQLKVEVEENRILRVSGERKRDQEDQKAAGDHWHRVERCYGKFLRQFRLPENVDLDSISASLQNGVLTISISKLSPDRIKGPKLITVVEKEEATSSHSQLNSHVKEEL